jgi:hypothetical protein
MDAAAHYRHLLGLGREDFLAAAAPAVLVRYRAPGSDPGQAAGATLTMTLDRGEEVAGEAVDETMPHGKFTPEPAQMELYPLAKKPGASFRDRITIGRTSNNDVVIADHSVSRLHAYIRRPAGWVVADAGSKNGSWLDGVVLEPRKEATLAPGATVRFGDVQLSFYRSEDLFDLMGGDHGRR